jgi:hypothetical protein
MLGDEERERQGLRWFEDIERQGSLRCSQRRDCDFTITSRPGASVSTARSSCVDTVNKTMECGESGLTHDLALV